MQPSFTSGWQSFTVSWRVGRFRDSLYFVYANTRSYVSVPQIDDRWLVWVRWLLHRLSTFSCRSLQRCLVHPADGTSWQDWPCSQSCWDVACLAPLVAALILSEIFLHPPLIDPTSNMLWLDLLCSKLCWDTICLAPLVVALALSP